VKYRNGNFDVTEFFGEACDGFGFPVADLHTDIRRGICEIEYHARRSSFLRRWLRLALLAAIG
jgi:hypothetical protein